jgi:hypothetical protein
MFVKKSDRREQSGDNLVVDQYKGGAREDSLVSSISLPIRSEASYPR